MPTTLALWLSAPPMEIRFQPAWDGSPGCQAIDQTRTDEVLGWARYTIEGDVLRLLEIEVSSALRRCGIGTTLLKAIQAKHQGEYRTVKGCFTSLASLALHCKVFGTPFRVSDHDSEAQLTVQDVLQLGISLAPLDTYDCPSFMAYWNAPKGK